MSCAREMVARCRSLTRCVKTKSPGSWTATSTVLQTSPPTRERVFATPKRFHPGRATGKSCRSAAARDTRRLPRHTCGPHHGESPRGSRGRTSSPGAAGAPMPAGDPARAGCAPARSTADTHRDAKVPSSPIQCRYSRLSYTLGVNGSVSFVSMAMNPGPSAESYSMIASNDVPSFRYSRLGRRCPLEPHRRHPFNTRPPKGARQQSPEIVVPAPQGPEG